MYIDNPDCPDYISRLAQTVNALNFIQVNVYRNIKRGNHLKQTTDSVEFIQSIVQLAQDECWPTGYFDENSVYEAINEFVKNNPNKALFNPPNSETAIRLFKEGRIGGFGEFAIW